MKKIIGKLFAISAALVLTACGNKADKKGGESSKDVDKEANIKISVQLEEDWRKHYEAAAERVKKEFPNAEIELRTIGGLEPVSYTHLTLPTKRIV